MASGRGTWYKNCHHGRIFPVPLSLYCLVAWWILGSATGELLETPSLRWTVSLNTTSKTKGRSLRQGNAVIVSSGGDKLFVTANDGSLHILGVTGKSPTTLAVFQPDLVNGTLTECRSSVVPVQRTTDAGDVVSYLVYSVIDTPETVAKGDEILNQTSSRVIAVNLDGTLRWSVTVPGKLAGTPAVGINGQLIYVSHNVATNKGFLSVILSTKQGRVAELVASLAPQDRDAPLGPPSLQRILTSTNNDKGGAGGAGAGGAGGTGGADATASTAKDLVAVAESWGDGFAQVGGVYLLTQSSDFEDTGGSDASSYQLLVVSRSSFSLSAVMAPLFVDTSLWLGGSSGAFGGFTENQDLSNVLQGREEDIAPLWIFQYEMNPVNATQPFVVTPEISLDGSELYLPGTSNTFYCLQSSSGQMLWSTTVESVVLSRPVAFSSSNDASVLYFIESADGRVRQLSTSDSTENWQFNCASASGVSSCQDSVEADFSVSPSGNLVYYGDITGQISALQVATFTTVAPTSVPTPSPSSAPSAITSSISSPTSVSAATQVPTVGQAASSPIVPTTAPTLYTGPVLGPSVFNAPESSFATANGNNQNSDDLSVGLIVGVAIAGLVVVGLTAFFVARILHHPQAKRKTRSIKESTVLVNETDGDIEADLESSGDDEEASDSVDEDDLDDVTVTSASDSVEIEVAAASNLYSTPAKKTRSRKKRKKLRTPPTTTTLASIQEAEDEEIAALPTEEHLKVDLNDKFRAVETKTPVMEGGANVNANRSPINHFRPLADDMSQGSDEDDAVPPPPPERLTPLLDNQNFQDEEEKKDGEFDSRSFGTLSPQPSFGMTSDSQAPLSPAHSTGSLKSFMSSVAAVLSRSPGGSEASKALSPAASGASPSSFRSPGTPSGHMSPSVLSTDSSLYTDDQSRNSTDRLSPLSAGIFGGNDQVSLPDDEAMSIAHPSLSHSFDHREDSVLGIGRAPGAHYLNKASPAARPKFKPSGASKVPKVKSARTKRNLNGFSGSYLQSEHSSGEENDDEARIRSKSSVMDTKKAPMFKRRSKKDEPASRSSNMIEDTWNSFLNDLAAAEQQFFSPTHSQKSAVLRYNVDDDETTLSSAHVDDDATVRTGTV